MSELLAALCAGALIMFRAGMMLHEAGSLRAKNSVSAILRNIADICVAVLAFWVIGGAISTNGVLGFRCAFILGGGPTDLSMLLVGMAAMSLTSGIVGGVLAERSRLLTVLAASVALAAVASPLAAYWARAGWLSRLGFHDLAGASFLHVSGAAFALVGAIMVGPRMGKYNRDGSSNAIPGHSVPLAGVGVLLMLAACLPYLTIFSAVRGGSIANVAVNGLLAAAGGALASLILSNLRYGKPDVHLVYAGLIGGVIAISAGADIVAGWAAVLIGAVAGILVPMLMLSIDLLWHVDDATSAISMHGVGGAWGIIAAGIFARGGAVSGRVAFFGAQVLGLIVIAALAGLLALGLFAGLRLVTRLRVREEDEFDGLDLAEHDIGAYPDFQQTMIKSYHLREA